MDISNLNNLSPNIALKLNLLTSNSDILKCYFLCDSYQGSFLSTGGDAHEETLTHTFQFMNKQAKLGCFQLEDLLTHTNTHTRIYIAYRTF